MTRKKSINLQRVESVLQELIPEALSTFEDNTIKGLSITSVDCSRGKYDADVYFYVTFMSDIEIKEIEKSLKKVSSKVGQYVLASTNWYRSPKFHFKYDKSVDKMSRMEELFARIKKSE